MNFWFIGTFVLLALCIVSVLIMHRVIEHAADDKATAPHKVTVAVSSMIILFSLLLIFAGVALHGKFKVDEMFHEYEQLIERVAYKDSMTDIDRFILEQDVNDWNMRLSFNNDRLHNFWSPMGNLYEIKPILVEI